nr:transposase [Brachybacterium paraconglomeratum]
MLDAFHIVKLASAAVDDVRRRVQQETLGYRGRKGDPLYGIRHLLRAGRERLTSRQQNRLAIAFAAHPDHVAVEVTYKCTQDVREAFHQPTLPRGRRLAEQLIEKLPSCPIPEIARLGKTLRRWRTAFLAYFDTDGASNGGTEAINGIIKLGRRIARGLRNFEHYRLRMLLIACDLDASPHTQL